MNWSTELGSCRSLDLGLYAASSMLAESKGKGAVVGKKKMGLGKNRSATKD